MSAASPTGIGGSAALIIANGPVDIDRFRQRRYNRLVVVHARGDGSLDDRVRTSFIRAIVVGETTGQSSLRYVADFALARLEPAGILEFVDPTPAAAQDIAAALPHLNVAVIPAPSSEGAQSIEVTTRTQGPKRSFLRRIRGRR